MGHLQVLGAAGSWPGLASLKSGLLPQPAAPGLHIPGVVGLRLSLGFQAACPLEGEASPLPRGHVLLVRNQEQLRVLPMCSERVHQSVTWVPGRTGRDGLRSRAAGRLCRVKPSEVHWTSMRCVYPEMRDSSGWGTWAKSRRSSPCPRGHAGRGIGKKQQTKEKQRRVRDPSGELAGWGHAHMKTSGKKRQTLTIIPSPPPILLPLRTNPEHCGLTLLAPSLPPGGSSPALHSLVPPGEWLCAHTQCDPDFTGRVCPRGGRPLWTTVLVSLTFPRSELSLTMNYFQSL